MIKNKMGSQKRVIISWGFVVSLLSLVWAIFTWWDAGQEDKPDWQDKQNRLISDLIVETRNNRIEFQKFAAIAKAQLEKSEYNNQLTTSIAESLAEQAESSPPKITKEQVASIVKEDIGKSQDKAIEKTDPAVGKVGWVYFGRFDEAAKSWDAKYHKIAADYNDSNIARGETVTIAKNVGFNNKKPSFPNYEKGLARIYPYSLDPGTIVEVIEVDDSVGWRGFTWGRVKILSMARGDSG